MARFTPVVACIVVTCCAALSFAACSGDEAGTASPDGGTTSSGAIGDANDDGARCKLTVGGIVSGLAGKGLALRNAMTAETVVATAEGAYTFSKPLCKGDAYAITIQQNPTAPWQTCAFVDPARAAGAVDGASILDVNVRCRTNAYDVSVRFAGLVGTGLVILNEPADRLEVAADGTFTFPTKVESGASYAVTRIDPILPWQTCTITSPIGRVTNADVLVTATCTTGVHTVGGQLIGLKGSGLVLTNNDGGDLTLGTASNGLFAFATALKSGASYDVKVKTQPTGAADERCIVDGASGKVTGAKVESVSVRCGSKRVFVSSAMYNGNVGGLTGADEKCQTLADASNLGGTYMAWISTDAGSPSSRFTRSLGPYVLVNGTVVANDWNDLTDGTLAAPINTTEKNGPAPTGTACSNLAVWSSTNANGTSSGNACSNFTADSGSVGRWGDASSTNNGWWSARCGGGSCSPIAPIYCFEQ